MQMPIGLSTFVSMYLSILLMLEIGKDPTPG